MDQQQQQQEQGQVSQSGDPADTPTHPAASEASDDTWGLGSATALDSLRRQNFRGRRSNVSQDSPSSSD